MSKKRKRLSELRAMRALHANDQKNESVEADVGDETDRLKVSQQVNLPGRKIQDLSILDNDPLKLPTRSTDEFLETLREILQNPNLGAGITASGASGSGKSNASEIIFIESVKLGIPCLHIDPHGDSARKLTRMIQILPERQRSKVLYVDLSDPDCIVSINPLEHPENESELSPYQLGCFERIRLELTASIILAAVGEAGAGFGSRPVLRKWVMMWLRLLYRANLRLPDARMLLDPHHPIYEQLLKLAPDDLARFQMAALLAMKSVELENEIGSSRNRMLILLDHPATCAILGRRDHCLDMRYLYENGYSMIFNISRGDMLTEEVQSLLANIVLVQYLQVVFATPEHKRKRRLCLIDELPVFVDACGPLLERIVTEVRKFKTSFAFSHQGANRFKDRTENPFLLTLMDMCRVKLLFRHNIDADFFGRQISVAASDHPRVKQLQVAEQQLQDGHDILELVDFSDGSTNTSGDTASQSESDALTTTLATAVATVDMKSSNKSESRGRTTQQGGSQHSSRSSSSNRTVKQTAVARIITKQVVTGTTFYTPDEIDRKAASLLRQQDTGEAVVIIDGAGTPFSTMTPLARDPYGHAPKFGAKKIAQWLADIHTRSEFVSPTQILIDQSAFQQQLLEELYLMESPATSDNLELRSAASLPQKLLTPSRKDAHDELGL